MLLTLPTSIGCGEADVALACTCCWEAEGSDTTWDKITLSLRRCASSILHSTAIAYFDC